MAKSRATPKPKPKAAPKKSSEADMAQWVVSHLEHNGFTTYKEVAIRGGGSDRADIYGVNGHTGMTVSVETKTTFSIKVIEQAWQWVGKAHKVFIAVPAAKNRSERYFARDLCSMLGIGVMEVSGSQVRTIEDAKFDPAPVMPKLFEEQKESVAGNAVNEYVTPYKLTAQRIVEFMRDKKSFPLRTLVLSVQHHYKTPSSARSALSKLISMGIIEGLTMQGLNVVHTK